MRQPLRTASIPIAALLLAVALAHAQSPAAGPAAALNPGLPHEHLVWSDDFDQASSADIAPSPKNWVFETGGDGWGNDELETYCAFADARPPCDPAAPTAFVGSDGMLHLVARRLQAPAQPAAASAPHYISARLKTEGLQSFAYGRVEARIRVPGGTGIWPAFWMLGDDIGKGHPWPACGEIDIMESIGTRQPGIVHGTLHGTGFPPAGLTGQFAFPSAAALNGSFHRFGATWSPGRIAFYVDDPAHPYASFSPADMPPGAVWPFDSRRFFILLNLAVGGRWPGPPDEHTPFPAEMLVDYVRVWQREP